MPKRPPELDLHLIVDHYGTHKHPRVRLNFTPTSSSWLNRIERWSHEITQKRIRRGSFYAVKELVAAIETYIANHNQNLHIFVRTKSVSGILAKLASERASNI